MPVLKAHRQASQEEPGEEADLAEEIGEETLAQMRGNAANSVELATNILDDSELYFLAKATQLLAKPGRQAYLNILHQHSLGPEYTARWLAWRAGGGWFDACRECAMVSGAHDLEDAIGLQPGRWPESARVARAENFMCMMVELIAQRAWQQAERSVVLPDVIFTFFDTSPEKSEAGLAKAKRVWSTILHAVKVRESGYRGKTLVKAVLDDCYFAENALVKDLMLWLQRLTASTERDVGLLASTFGVAGAHHSTLEQVLVGRRVRSMPAGLIGVLTLWRTFCGLVVAPLRTPNLCWKTVSDGVVNNNA
jgi:hypothetical protein